jgi:hypothetical protein
MEKIPRVSLLDPLCQTPQYFLEDEKNILKA